MNDRSRAGRLLAHFAMGVCVFASACAHAAADSQDVVVIDTDNNVVLAGGRVSPGKPVPENFVGAGGRVVIDQTVGQNAVALGGTVEVHSAVGDNLRAAGGTITVDAPVQGNFSAAGADIRITRAATIARNARILGGSIVVDGRVDGSLKATADKVVINGVVHGDVKLAADTIELGPEARIDGDLKYVSATAITQAPGAKVGGAITRQDEFTADREWRAPGRRSTASIVAGFVVGFLLLLGCGALFVSIAPIFSVEAPERLNTHPLNAIGLGALTLVGAPVLALLFLITLVGIPVTVLLVALYPFAMLLGYVVATLWVASFAARLMRRPPPPTVKAAVGHFAVALAIVMLAGKVPVLGGWVTALLFAAGIGAFEVELYRRIRSGSRALAGRVEVVRP